MAKTLDNVLFFKLPHGFTEIEVLRLLRALLDKALHIEHPPFKEWLKIGEA